MDSVLPDDAGAWLTLNRVPGLGSRTLCQLLQRCPDPEALLNAPAVRLRELEVPERLRRALCQADRVAAQADLAWLDAPGRGSLDQRCDILHDMCLTMTSTIRTFFLAVIVTGLIACGDSSSSPAVDSPDAIGPFGVGHSSFNVVDPARDDRPLLVDAWYPVDAADAQESPLTEYPLADPLTLPSEVAVDDLPVSARSVQTLLVFSHGYQGINIQSFELMEALASHGFIVISPEHTGNA